MHNRLANHPIRITHPDGGLAGGSGFVEMRPGVLTSVGVDFISAPTEGVARGSSPTNPRTVVTPVPAPLVTISTVHAF
jgi:hypothetical protein